MSAILLVGGLPQFTLVRQDGGRSELLAMQHESFSRNTRVQLKQVFDALRELMTQPEPTKRPIGFVTHEEKKNTKSSAGRKR